LTARQHLPREIDARPIRQIDVEHRTEERPLRSDGIFPRRSEDHVESTPPQPPGGRPKDELIVVHEKHTTHRIHRPDSPLTAFARIVRSSPERPGQKDDLAVPSFSTAELVRDAGAVLQKRGCGAPERWRPCSALLGCSPDRPRSAMSRSLCPMRIE